MKKIIKNVDLRLDNGIARLTFTDNGVLFNPTTAKEPDTDADINERSVGGVGIMIVKNISDGIFYRVKDRNNQLTVLKDLK